MKAILALFAVYIAVAVAQPSVSGTFFNYGCGALNPLTLASTSISCATSGSVANFTVTTNPTATATLSGVTGTSSGIGTMTISIGSLTIVGSASWATVSGVFQGQVQSMVNTGSSVANCSGAFSQLATVYTQFNLVCIDMSAGTLWGVALAQWGIAMTPSPTANFNNATQAFSPSCNCTGSVAACPSLFTQTNYKATYSSANSQFLLTLSQAGYGGSIVIAGRAQDIVLTNTGIIIEAAVTPISATNSPVMYPAGYASVTPSNLAGTYTYASGQSVITLYSYNLQGGTVCTMYLTQTAGVSAVVANMLVVALLAVASVVLSVVM